MGYSSENLKKHAVLIVAAVIGKGTKLLSISRDLRDIHTGAKNYLVGFQVSDSIFDYEKLRKNLEYSSNKSKNIFSSMDSFAIGTSLANTYRNEKIIPFYDSSTRNEPLLLRNDFAMWDTSYDPSEDHSASVLLTMASILQNARESKEFEDTNDRLNSDTLQQVVLDPENFARFNDGIIQAALLRAAHPQELDYSSDRETSRHMKEILKNIFLSFDRDQGEASYEMAHALRSKKLRICNEDFKELMDTIHKSLKGRKGKSVDYLKSILFPDSSITDRSEKPI